jgi:AcrR family transcriptional regulator
MTRKPRTEPRKTAVQERSRATVDALIEATARILVKDGFDKASTNRIAEVAGVSVGSLYQYFPGKEALVVAVIERHRQAIARAIRGELAVAIEQPVEEGVRTLVAAAVKGHRVDPALHRVLAEQIPRVGKLEKAQTFDRANFVLFRSYLERHRDEIRVDDLDLATFICVTSIEAVTHNAVLHRSDMLSDTTVDDFIAAAARLVVGYLVDAQGPRRGGTSM